MDKPTSLEIVGYVGGRKGLFKVEQSAIGDSLRVTFFIKSQGIARLVEKTIINSVYGAWVYVGLNDTYRDYCRVWVVWRSEELYRCPECKWQDNKHSSYCDYAKYLDLKIAVDNGEVYLSRNGVDIVVGNIAEYQNVHGDGIVNAILVGYPPAYGVDIREFKRVLVCR